MNCRVNYFTREVKKIISQRNITRQISRRITEQYNERFN